VNAAIDYEVEELEQVVAYFKPFVIVGIPAFNEETTIGRVVLEAKKFADAVVVCDDGSTDLTGKIAQGLGADLVTHDQNLGYGAAVKSLFERARELNADVMVTLDADGQHDASEIPNILEPAIHGDADVVIGSRFVKPSGAAEMPFHRRIGAKIITKLVNGSSKNNVTDSQSGFRAYSRRALRYVTISETGMGASTEILLRASKHSLNIREVPCSCKYHKGGAATSTEHPLAHGIGVVMSIVRFVAEERPLLTLGIPGLFFLFAGIFFDSWLFQVYALTNRIVTNIALASVAFTLIGFFLLSEAITLYAISKITKNERNTYATNKTPALPTQS
jgi:glycosyltransferase involved in cell wall biosynthesis